MDFRVKNHSACLAGEYLIGEKELFHESVSSFPLTLEHLFNHSVYQTNKKISARLQRCFCLPLSPEDCFMFSEHMIFWNIPRNGQI
jgi:hypothetical protein